MSKKFAFIILFSFITITFSLYAQETYDFLKPVREYTVHDWETEKDIEYIVDDSTATFSITVPEKLEEEVYEGEGGLQEEVLYSNFYDAMKDAEYQVLPSLELCGQRGKFFDDGMYACVEVNLENGVEGLPGGKPEFLRKGLKNLLSIEGEVPDSAKDGWKKAIVYLTTAVLLGEGELIDNVSDDLMDKAKKEKREFIDTPYFSKPLGFYNWSKELQKIYTRDKWLQKTFLLSNKDGFLTAFFIAYAFLSDEELDKQQRFLLNTYSKLTNKLVTKSVPYIVKILGVDLGILNSNKFEKIYDDISKKDIVFSLMPLSRSKEVDLAKKMMGKPISEGSLMEELIKQIKAGEMSLKPDEDSGWYEYQQYALETFLTVDELKEGQKLILDEGYEKRLEEAFRSMLTQARETHIKQLEKYGETSAAPEPLVISVSPEFSLEPLPTYYRRVGVGYEFLGQVLGDIFTQQEMTEVYGLREGGKLADKSLSEDLNWIYRLFLGFYIEASKNIGITPELYDDELEIAQESLQQANNWLKNWKDDPLMKKDIRVIVPLGPTDDGNLNNWAVLGVRRIVINVKYDKKPQLKTLNTDRVLNPTFESKDYTVLVPVFSEVITPGKVPLNRDEFRTICDKYRTKEEIIKALKKGEGGNSYLKNNLIWGFSNVWFFSALGVILIVVLIVIILVIRNRRRRDKK